MKRLKEYQLGPYCSFCPSKTIRATFKSRGFSSVKYCCDEHRKLLTEYEQKMYGVEDYYTEADYQTWFKL